ncbi:hypothetical protein HC251_07450 [Iamia sp. SCSIO 61187]|uniref:sulfotransferase n=1 Tax=Iamia sp. SCSIO 61187 TaxID=2722752 RepID=UPI001C625795|nr:sulfotransferase [Iamia sp. SCSIO 61187]QYG92292.1 hypothetical protein HC251_07450 [Iamia sp. SCSIO 61187]
MTAPLAPVVAARPGAAGHADVVVVGAPRSGTSLVAQLVAASGVDFGDHLLPPDPGNPRGFLEDTRVSDLDDELLAPHVVGRGLLPVPEARLAWVGAPDPGVRITAAAGQRQRMAALLAGAGPRGIKDPRLVWTFAAWRPVLRPGTRCVAIVRHPAEVAVSLRTMWERDRSYYGALEVTVERGLALWTAANRRLAALVEGGGWLVLDHAALLAGEGVDALTRFTGRPVPAGGVDPALHRSARRVPVPAAAERLYADLSARARSDATRWAGRGR